MRIWHAEWRRKMFTQLNIVLFKERQKYFKAKI